MNRKTEFDSFAETERDAWMQRRIRYYGEACLTRQEYRAVVFSLYGLPEVVLKEGVISLSIESPTQDYVAHKMCITRGRVSQLLKTAATALLWFETHETPNVGWTRAGRSQGSTSWVFNAPVLDRPIPPEARAQKVVVQIVRPKGQVHGIYKLAFAGDL